MTDLGTLDLFDWADYLVVSTSGGIDSAAIIDVTAAEAQKRGVLSKVVAVHADMGRMEWKSAAELGREAADGFDPRGSTDLAKAQADAAGIERFEIVRREQGDLLEQVEEKGVWSRVGMGACQGTSDHKRDRIFTLYTRLAKEFKAANPTETRRVRIVEIVGLARHEGGEGGKRDKRLRKLEVNEAGGRVELNAKASNATKREVISWFPISDWTKSEIREHLAKARAERGAPGLSWVYGAGMPRLSCSFCVFAQKDSLNLAGQLDPVTLEEYVRVEKKIGVDFRKEFSLESIQTDLAEGRLASAEEARNAWDDQN